MGEDDKAFSKTPKVFEPFHSNKNEHPSLGGA